MNPRVVAILVLLLAVLGGGALLYYQQERSRQAANVGVLGRPLMGDVRVADITSIRIEAPEGTLLLERRDDGWGIAERAGFPADLGKVRKFVLDVIALKVGQSEPIGEQDRARLALDASGTRVAFADAAGKTLGALTVGKKYFKGEPEDPQNAPGDGRFVSVPGEPKTVYLVSDPLTQATTSTAAWIDRTAFKVEKVGTLEVRYPDGNGWRIERKADNAEWTLRGARPGEKLEITRANAASYSLSLLELADVAPKDAKDTGLDKPTLIHATTLDGVEYRIRVGKLEGDNYYVSFSSSSDKPLDKRQAQHVLLIPKDNLADTLKKRADLLERPEKQ